MNNVIYAYRKKSNQKIVYIGQTVNLQERHYKHIKHDPFNVNIKEYEYPLSRGIRKYGEEEYDLIILEENLKKEELNEKEKYWISFYDTYFNGYNQSTGGSNPVKPVFTEDKIDLVIEMLKDESYSYKDILEKTGISMTHIYNINTGKRRKREDISYPIRESNTKGTRGLKLSPDECRKVHHLLQNTRLSYEELAEHFNCTKNTISNINRGQTKSYRLNDYNYPIRDSHTVRQIGCEYKWKIKKESNIK